MPTHYGVLPKDKTRRRRFEKLFAPSRAEVSTNQRITADARGTRRPRLTPGGGGVKPVMVEPGRLSDRPRFQASTLSDVISREVERSPTAKVVRSVVEPPIRDYMHRSSLNIAEDLHPGTSVTRPTTPREVFSPRARPADVIGREEQPRETIIDYGGPTAITRKLTPEGTRYTIRGREGGFGTVDVGRPITGPRRGAFSDTTLDTPSGGDFYAGHDVSQMTPGEYAQFKIDTANRGAEAFRQLRQAQDRGTVARNEQTTNAFLDQLDREENLRNYRRDLDEILGDSADRRLTAKGTRNAIAALNTFYGEKLGLSPREEEAGKTRRALIGAEAVTEAERIRNERVTPPRSTNRYDFEQDLETGDTVRYDKRTGEVSTVSGARKTSLMSAYRKALDEGRTSDAEDIKRQLMKDYGEDPDVEF